MKKLAFVSYVVAIVLGSAGARGALLYGLDAKGETAAGAANATFNEAAGLGVAISGPTTLANWLTATANPNTTVTPAFNAASANVTLVTPAGFFANTLTTKVDMTGSHAVTFEKFAIGFQRGGNANGNVVSGAEYSVDGINFLPASVQEVAVGLNNGTNNVGPADTISSFRVPDGLGGTIGPQQVYVVDGLNAAGALTSGSFWIRMTVNVPTGASTQTTLTMLNDRYDVTTTAMALSATNTTDLGADDGYDIAWYGTAVAVPEPTSILLGFVAIGSASVVRHTPRRRV